MTALVPDRSRTIRNLILFAIAAAGGGFLGIAIDRLSPPQDPMQGLGALVWLSVPLLANILLRALGRDGWKDFGLGSNLRKGGVWYLAGLLIVPLVTLLTLGSALLLGGVSLAGNLTAFLPLAGAAFAGSMLKNIFEEFAWRGYLTPRFAALGTPLWLGYLLTGWIWAAWHIPYYLYFLPRSVLASHTSLGPVGIILLALALLPLQAFAYGELRLASKSVWPAWLMHTVANAISLVLISGGFVTIGQGAAGILLSPGSEGVLYSLLMGGVGYGLYRVRAARNSQ
jgi:membrane protease YdiL (CAAX protease family)